MNAWTVELMLAANGGKSPSHLSNGPFRIVSVGLRRAGEYFKVVNSNDWKVHEGTRIQCEKYVERMNLRYAEYLMVKS